MIFSPDYADMKFDPLSSTLGVKFHDLSFKLQVKRIGYYKAQMEVFRAINRNMHL